MDVYARLKIMVYHRSFSDPLAIKYMTEQDQFGRTYVFYCAFPMGKSMIAYNDVPTLNE